MKRIESKNVFKRTEDRGRCKRNEREKRDKKI